MERYTQFRDKATGISPFLPVLQTNVIGVNKRDDLLKTLKLNVALSFLIFIVKLVFVIPILILCLITFGQVYYLNRCLLFVMGLYSYELSIQNLRSRTNINKNFYPNKNEVFLVNFTSPLDLCVLKLISNDDFVILIPNLKGDLVEISSLEFIQQSLKGDVLNKIEKIDYNKITNKIIYIFPEGTTSNGKAILPFLLTQDSLDNFISNFNPLKIKTLGIKLYPSTLTTPLNYSIQSYLYKLLTLLSFEIKIRINSPNELDSKDSNLLKLRNSFTNNGKFKLISNELDFNKKQKFIESYVGRR